MTDIKVGDVIELRRKRHNPDLPWSCNLEWLHKQVGCRCNLNEDFTVLFTVTEMMHFADNSVEAWGHLEDGTPYHEMVVAPHGDRCF